MANVSRYCSDMLAAHRVEVEYEILVESHLDYHHVAASSLFWEILSRRTSPDPAMQASLVWPVGLIFEVPESSHVDASS